MSQTTRRRIVRTPIATVWAGASALSVSLPDNVGLAQHQIFVSANAPVTAGIVNIMVRPAKATFFVPVGSVDLTKVGGVLLLQGLIDGVLLQPTTLVAGATVSAGVLSVGTDFAPARGAADEGESVRRRFGQCMVASQWNGATSITMACEDQAGFAQHQVAVTGGTGRVRLLGRPVGFTNFVDVGFGCDSLDAAGSLVVFSGMYDAFCITANGTLSGSISAQVDGCGEEMFFPPTWAELQMGASNFFNDFITTIAGAPIVTMAGDFMTQVGA